MILMPLVLGRLIYLIGKIIPTNHSPHENHDENSVGQFQLVIVQRLVKNLYLALIANYHYNYMLSIACDHIPQSVYKCVVLQNAFKSLRWLPKPFSTEAFEDKQFKLIDDCLRSRA